MMLGPFTPLHLAIVVVVVMMLTIGRGRFG